MMDHAEEHTVPPTHFIESLDHKSGLVRLVQVPASELAKRVQEDHFCLELLKLSIHGGPRCGVFQVDSGTGHEEERCVQAFLNFGAVRIEPVASEQPSNPPLHSALAVLLLYEQDSPWPRNREATTDLEAERQTQRFLNGIHRLP